MGYSIWTTAKANLRFLEGNRWSWNGSQYRTGPSIFTLFNRPRWPDRPEVCFSSGRGALQTAQLCFGEGHERRQRYADLRRQSYVGDLDRFLGPFFSFSVSPFRLRFFYFLSSFLFRISWLSTDRRSICNFCVVMKYMYLVYTLCFSLGFLTIWKTTTSSSHVSFSGSRQTLLRAAGIVGLLIAIQRRAIDTYHIVSSTDLREKWGKKATLLFLALDCFVSLDHWSVISFVSYCRAIFFEVVFSHYQFPSYLFLVDWQDWIRSSIEDIAAFQQIAPLLLSRQLGQQCLVTVPLHSISESRRPKPCLVLFCFLSRFTSYLLPF